MYVDKYDISWDNKVRLSVFDRFLCTLFDLLYLLAVDGYIYYDNQ